MSNVIIDKSKIDILANAISVKSGEAVTMTLDEMVEAVDGIETGGGTPTLETVTKTYTPSTSAVIDTITASAGYDGIEEVDVTVSAVPTGSIAVSISGNFRTINGTKVFRVSADAGVDSNNDMGAEGYISDHTLVSATDDYPIVPSGTSVTPTESAQTIGGNGKMMAGAVTVNAIPSNYVGTGITRRSSSDLTTSGSTVTAPAGYYESDASTTVAGGITVTDEANSTGITCVITSGSSPTPPSPDIPLNTQLIDYTAITTGYIVDGDTGEETVSQWSCCSDYTLIDPTMTFGYVGYQWYDIVFFTESKQYISKIYMDSDKDSVVNDYAHGTLNPAKIPQTAKYVRINTYPNTGISSTELSLIRTS